MLDFFHVLNNPGADVQYFEGTTTATLTDWQTWRKPRGANFIYMIGVGGGSSGGCGLNSTTTSGGGAGGGSGAQTNLFIPAFMVPDVLYVQAGRGGFQPAALVSAATGVAGVPSYVCIEPSNSAQGPLFTLLYSNPGAVTGAAAATTGGAAGTAAAVASISNMALGGRGFYEFLVGQSGTAGGSSTTAGTNITLPQTGLMVTGGAGGGGTNGAAPKAGGGYTISTAGLGNDWFGNLAATGGAAAVTSTPAGAGNPGYDSIHNLLNLGGLGGGAATATAGGLAGAGGNGAPGCGGGGAGGSDTTNNTLARPGNGGPGFVYIISMF